MSFLLTLATEILIPKVHSGTESVFDLKAHLYTEIFRRDLLPLATLLATLLYRARQKHHVGPYTVYVLLLIAHRWQRRKIILSYLM